MSIQFDFVEDDNVLLRITCKDGGGNVIDLSGGSVVLSWLTAYPDYLPVSRTMTITNALAGKAEYRFLPAELYSPKMKFDITITDIGGLNTSNSAILELAGRAKQT